MIGAVLGLLLGAAPTAEPASAPAPAPTTVSPKPRFSSEGWEQPPWDFVVVPVFGLNVDEGIGGGVLFAAHRYSPDTAVFRDDFALRIFLTSRFVQRHELKWEGLDVLDLPLRVWLRLGYFSTVTQNFCGTGNAVTCDERRAQDAARAAGHVVGTESFDAFVRHYHRVRFIRPHADALLRWALKDAPWKVELMGGARLAWYVPGDFSSQTPYPGSL